MDRVEQQQHQNDALLAATKMLCQLKGMNMSYQSLLNFIHNPCTPGHYRSATISQKKLHLEQLSNLHLPVVLTLDQGNACVLTQINSDNTAHIIAPDLEQNAIKVSLTDLNREYTGEIIMVSEDAVESVEFTSIAEFYRASAPKLLASSLLLAISMVLLLVIPAFMWHAMQQTISGQQWLLTSMVGMSVVILSISAIFYWLRRRLHESIAKQQEQFLKRPIIRLLSAMSLGQYHHYKSVFDNLYQNLISKVDTLDEANTKLICGVFSFIYLGIAAIFLGWLSIIPLVAMTLYISIALWLYQEAETPTTRSVIDTVDPYKLAGAESLLSKELYADVIARKNRPNHMSFYCVASVTLILLAVLSLHGIVANSLSIAGTSAGLILCVMAMLPYRDLSPAIMNFRSLQKSLTQVDKLQQELLSAGQQVSKQRLAGKIQLKDVSFCYSNSPEVLFNKLSLNIQPGGRVAIIGSMGTGKSTLLKLIAGMLQQDSGAINIDNTATHHYDPANLATHIGYVRQKPRLLNCTVRDNIAAKAPWVSDELIHDCLQSLGASQQFLSHPDGLARLVENHGRELSAGQRQLITIAQAVLLHPSILLLDEPTAALDNHAERQFIQHIANYDSNATIILITHKMALLNLVDRVIMMQEGNVIADGAKDQVLNMMKGIKKTTKQAQA